MGLDLHHFRKAGRDGKIQERWNATVTPPRCEIPTFDQKCGGSEMFFDVGGISDDIRAVPMNRSGVERPN